MQRKLPLLAFLVVASTDVHARELFLRGADEVATYTYDFEAQDTVETTALPEAPPGTGYFVYANRACQGRNELGIIHDKTLQECAAECNAQPTCISFEHGHSGQYTDRCQLSSSCTLDLFTECTACPNFDTFVKDGLSEVTGTFPPSDTTADQVRSATIFLS